MGPKGSDEGCLRGGMKGVRKCRETPHPSGSACHLLPQGEKGRATRRSCPDHPPSRSTPPAASPARTSATAPAPAPAGRRACRSRWRGPRPAPRISGRRNSPSPLPRRRTGPTAPAWSAGCRAGSRAGAASWTVWCRRCGSRRGCSARSRGWASSGCARRRWSGPSAATDKGCGRLIPAPSAASAPARPGRSGWAGSQPASCRRPSAPPAGRAVRPSPPPPFPADAGAATSPDRRTSRRTGTEALR